ncbi:SulP family inorganic anion transporter [Ilumatobacter nonamiensis]|uniref:SulP family inorganic anion transporter n=1 Tax=Ilumatobacter nonamiensis TaxID=467093 RepID=UPI00034811F3|nr:SulP family inorganic anion transporter [Ilumatobacter nonamiensis]
MTTTTGALGELARQVPAIGWLRGYDRSWLGRDLTGGLAAGAVVIPQAMAYATIAELPPEVGLYTCMVPMLVYALLGGSRTLSVSTTSTVAVLSGSTLLAAGVAADGTDPARELATLTILVGVILLGARLLRLGSLIDNISEATLIGIKLGVGLTVAAGQLPKLFGVDGDSSATAFFGEMGGLIDDLSDANGPTIWLSVATLGVLLGLGRLLPRVPAPLVATALGILLVQFWSIDDDGVALITPVPSGLPLPVLPDLDRAGALLGGAFAIAIMCFLETASAAGTVRQPDEPPIDNDQELVANGLACVLGGLFRAMPSAGGFSQTAINQRAGAKTQLSEIVTVLLAVACALFLGGVLSELPEATLGCMVVVAVLGLIKPAEFVRLWRIDRLSFWIAVLTAVAGLVFGLLEAVLAGVLITLLLVLYEMNQIGVTELQVTVQGDDLRVAGKHTRPVRGLLVLRVDGPVYTANARRVSRQILAAVDAEKPAVVIVDASATVRATVTVIDQLDELDQRIQERDASLWLTALPVQSFESLQNLPAWQAWDDEGRLHPTALAAVREYRTRT